MSSKVSFIRDKILFTLSILILYRILSFVPIPVIDIDKISLFLTTAKSGIFGMFNTLSGGAIARGSIFALGIMPYISSSIIIQIITLTTPEYKKIKKEDPDEFNKIVSKYSRYLAILVGVVQGFGIYSLLDSHGIIIHDMISNALLLKLIAISSLIMGTFILIWLADRISIKGIGNGTSLIIFTGIVAESPKDLANLFNMAKYGNISGIDLLIILGTFLLTLILVIVVEKSNRIISIQYPTQVVQMMNKSKESLPSFMPLKINPAGVIPPIFSNSLLLIPVTIISFLFKNSEMGRNITNYLHHGTTFFILANAILIMLFSFFYNNISFDPNEISEQLKKNNIFLPGIRPGDATVAFFSKVIKRLSFLGGVYLIIICTSHELLIQKYGSSVFLGGTSILIIVNIVTDTALAIQTAMLPSKYEKRVRRYR